jgi:transposase
MWCVPELDEEYRERMEDLLALYGKPHNPDYPVVCFDEKTVQLHIDKRPSSITTDGMRLYDSEYVRNGTANVFCACEPKVGKHFVKVTEHRKKADFAHAMREIAASYPKAKKIHLVLDNLNTHNKTSLVEAFGRRDGGRLWRRFAIHYTPKHGSWLNQAEIQISVFSRQCLGKQRMGDIMSLRKRASAWKRRANRVQWKINWRFTVADAREVFGY